MLPLDYIVRIYRFEQNNPKSLVGVVEEIGAEGKRAFTNLDELWRILNQPFQDIKVIAKDKSAK